MRDKYGVTQDKYCYPGTDVLINLLDIRDAELLADAEAEFTAHRYITYESSILNLSDCSFSHLKSLHYHLFQDLYDWAGTLRDVDISKGETRFCTWTRIEPEANKLFRELPALADCKRHNDLIEKVSDLFCELNMLHPFREGNGRVLRFFFEELLFLQKSLPFLFHQKLPLHHMQTTQIDLRIYIFSLKVILVVL